MIIGMADGEPRKSGGEGIGVCPKHFVPWVLTPVMGEFGVIVKGECHFFFSDQGPLIKAAVMWSIRAKESLIFLFVCLEAEMFLRAMRPTSSDAKLREEVGRHCVDRCVLPCERPFVVC